jgi:1-deoxy-D-xylulose-5-phosphate reductoisomerase
MVSGPESMQQEGGAERGRRRIAILGCTGSIGRQAAEVIRAHPERFDVVGLVARRDEAALAALASEFGAPLTGLGADAAVEIARADGIDVVLNAVVGAAGLRASIAALEGGKVLALANKESLVAGGAACLDAARRGGGTVVPVDSEHAALAQCLEGRDPATVAALVLTASGGPFRNTPDLRGVTPEDALAHPTWSMGRKITVDSATMMNKGLEVIEAHYLFGRPYDAIRVVVHPQSVVHGMVELVDGSVVMQAATPDMRLPIQAALCAPERIRSLTTSVDFTRVGSLTFQPVDAERFACVALAYEAGRAGGTFPAALNAANEVAVDAFLDAGLPFTEIPAVIEAVLDAHQPQPAVDLEAILEVDRWARDEAARKLARRGVLQPSAEATS